MRFATGATLILILSLLWPSSALALGLSESGCETRLRRVFESEVDRGDSVSVFLLNGSWARGHFDGLSTDSLSIRMWSSEPMVEPESHPLSEIGIVKYRKAGKFRPDVMLAGAFVGTVVGALGTAAFTEDACDGSEFCIPPAVGGGMIGAGVGLVVGTVVPPLLPSMRTARCGIE